MILCNPVNYELVKQQLRNACIDCEIIKSQYIEENMTTVVSCPNFKINMLGFCESKNLYDGNIIDIVFGITIIRL